jgi:hypothetical protein
MIHKLLLYVYGAEGIFPYRLRITSKALVKALYNKQSRQILLYTLSLYSFEGTLSKHSEDVGSPIFNKMVIIHSLMVERLEDMHQGVFFRPKYPATRVAYE